MQLALKLINSALQKQPKSQMLRALKAIALQRTGKDEEGLQVRLPAQTLCLCCMLRRTRCRCFFCISCLCITQLCEEVRREIPTDEQLLGTMTIFYRRANLLQNMSTAFAAACAAHPRDEGLLRGVFTCYVRQVISICTMVICCLLHGNCRLHAKHSPANSYSWCCNAHHDASIILFAASLMFCLLEFT